MLQITSVLCDLFDRDLDQLISEIRAYIREEDLWKVEGSISNSARQLGHMTSLSVATE